MKFILTNKPYRFFLGVVPLMILYGWLQNNDTLDINLYDTYFVISKNAIWTLLATLLLIYSVVYIILEFYKFRLITWLIWFHVTVTITTLLLMTISGYISDHFAIDEFQTMDLKRKSHFRSMESYIILTQAILFSIFLLAQVSFFLNLMGSILKVIQKSKIK